MDLSEFQIMLYFRSYWLRLRHLSAERRLEHWVLSCRPEWQAGRRAVGRGLHHKRNIFYSSILIDSQLNIHAMAMSHHTFCLLCPTTMNIRTFVAKCVIS